MHLEVHVADISFSFSHASNLTFLPEKKKFNTNKKTSGWKSRSRDYGLKTKTRKLDLRLPGC